MVGRGEASVGKGCLGRGAEDEAGLGRPSATEGAGVRVGCGRRRCWKQGRLVLGSSERKLGRRLGARGRGVETVAAVTLGGVGQVGWFQA